MPDGRLAPGLLATSRRLVRPDSKRPSQANLRRAISTAYYAVFHALAKMCADRLVGATKSTRPNKAWVEVYRGLVHGECVTACEGARNINFPDEIKDFADSFVQLQRARESCDYDPMVRPTKDQARMYIFLAERTIEALRSTSTKDQIAFTTWVLITSKGAKRARVQVREGKEGKLAIPQQN
jgi:hypothetical protein